jgi:nitrile hydratase subunit beta
MNGVHDMGGTHGHGPVVRDEAVFHAEWEKRVSAIFNKLVERRLVNVDEFRHALERIEPGRYLASGYYDRWLLALGTLIDEKGIGSSSTVEIPRRPTASSSAARPARFEVGDQVTARNQNRRGHTRLPRYVRGKRGIVRRVEGPFVLPDTNAHGLGPDPEHVYTVEFDGPELWGEDAEPRQSVLIDLWESYLQEAKR